MVGQLRETKEMITPESVEFIQEGRFAAEVPVMLMEDEGGWSPYFSVEDVRKLQAVRKALRDGDLATAAKFGRVFELVPKAR
jgi:hypothetical protein